MQNNYLLLTADSYLHVFLTFGKRGATEIFFYYLLNRTNKKGKKENNLFIIIVLVSIQYRRGCNSKINLFLKTAQYIFVTCCGHFSGTNFSQVNIVKNLQLNKPNSFTPTNKITASSPHCTLLETCYKWNFPTIGYVFCSNTRCDTCS